jgi:ribonuclease HII
MLSELEFSLKKQGYNYICGIDEAGRGALAGPVVVGSVIINEKIDGITDSKKIRPKKRELLFKEIQKQALTYSVGIIYPNVIDKINILNATKKGVVKSVELLKQKPDILVLDALKVKEINIEQLSFIKGDLYIYSIGAASIIAKVIRDRIMRYYDKIYPQYGFASHKGYGTKLHIRMIRENGISPIHRKSFEPIYSLNKGDLFER